MDDDELDAAVHAFLLAEGRQCALPGFRARDVAFVPRVPRARAAASEEEADVADETMPAEVRAMVGGARDRVASTNSVRVAKVLFRNGWVVSVLTCDASPSGYLAVNGDRATPSFEVAVIGRHLREMREPEGFVGVDDLDRILAEVEAAPDVRTAGTSAVQ